MADGDLLSLLLKVEGGEASAAEVQKLKDALSALDAQTAKEDAALQERFQHNFQHLALKGFISDAARSVGLGSELRPVISLLNMGITEMEGALGATAAAFVPYVAALAAVAALGYVVYEHFKKNSEGLEEAVKGYRETIAAIDEYVIAGGRLTEALKKEKESTDALLASTVREIESKTKSKMVTDEQTLSAWQATVAIDKMLEARDHIKQSTEADTLEMQKHQKVVDDDRLTLEANQHGFATFQEYVKAGTEKLKENTKAHEDLAKQEREAGKAADEEAKSVKDAADAMNKGEATLAQKQKELQDQEIDSYATVQEAKLKAVDLFRDKALAAAQDVYENSVRKANEEGLDITRITQQYENTLVQIENTTASKRNQITDSMAIESKKIGTAIEDGFAQSFAKTLVEGKRWQDQVKALEMNVAETIIADLIKIGIEDALQAARRIASAQAATASIGEQVAAVNALTFALAAATKQALALDAALIVAAA